jgi:uncharacterized protein YndB with AHSA1/START domain
MRMWGLALALAGLMTAAGARAEVVDASPSGFQVKETVEIAAPAAKVWAALGRLGAWWNPKHSWSGDAKNLDLDLRLGGCFCEALASGAGGAAHMRVIFVVPAKTAILDGTLGPLMFSGAAGHLIWSLAEQDGKTTLTQTYYVGGYFQGGLDKLAPDVDDVLGEQLTRLKSFVETSPPTSEPPPPQPPPSQPPPPRPRRGSRRG